MFSIFFFCYQRNIFLYSRIYIYNELSAGMTRENTFVTLNIHVDRASSRSLVVDLSAISELSRKFNWSLRS